MFERLGRRLAGSVLLWDLIATLLCLYSTTSVRMSIELGMPLTTRQAQIPWQLYPLVVCVWTVVFLLLTPQQAILSQPLVDALGRLLVAVVLSVLVFAGLLYLSFRELSRLQFLYFGAIDLVALMTIHLAARAYARYRARNDPLRRILIVGSGPQAEQLVEVLKHRVVTGVRVVGCTTNQPNPASTLAVLGPVSSTPEIVRTQRIDEVIFATVSHEDVARLSLQLHRDPVMLHMVPSVLDLVFARTPVANVGGVPLISLRESALTEGQRLLKRLMDVLGSVLLLLLFSPLMAAIAVMIKLESRGPVFFYQERVGEHGRHFKMIKFRSMYQDADKQWQEVTQRHADGGLVHKLKDDPRVTGVGRKLRRASLDELPQLINVLRGEMSLVGPRPEMPYMTAEYAPWQWQRFRVPAGMTGWWQVNGRSAKPMHLHTEDDLYYIQNYSFWLDLKILWMTIPAVLRGKGAF